MIYIYKWSQYDVTLINDDIGIVLKHNKSSENMGGSDV